MAANENKPLPEPTSRNDFPASVPICNISSNDRWASSIRSSFSLCRNLSQFFPKPNRSPRETSCECVFIALPVSRQQFPKIVFRTLFIFNTGVLYRPRRRWLDAETALQWDSFSSSHDARRRSTRPSGGGGHRKRQLMFGE